MTYVTVKSNPNLGIGKTAWQTSQIGSSDTILVRFTNGDEGYFYREDLEILRGGDHRLRLQLQEVNHDRFHQTGGSS